MAHKKKVSKVLQEVRENALFAHKVERTKKGKGSYTRKEKYNPRFDGG